MKLFNALAGLLFAFTAVSVQAQPRELPDFTDLVERQGPAVVNISTTQVVRSGRTVPQLPFDEDDPMFEFFKRFIPKQPGGGGQREQETKSLGSGFIISPDGYVLTNAHVVESAEEILVKLGDKREFKAKVIGSDKRTDIALIKIEATGLPAVRMGDPTKLRVGEWVVAIGSPFGFESSVTAGIVSAKGRSLPQETFVPFIQTDVAINPGNSGGPLFNMKGEVVGINSQIYSRTGGFMGLSFAIPIDVAMEVQQALRTSGKGEPRPHRRRHPGTDQGIGGFLRIGQAGGGAGQFGGKGRSRGQGGHRGRRHHPQVRRQDRECVQRSAAYRR